MAYLYFLLLICTVIVSAISLARSSPLSENSDNSQMTHPSQNGMASVVRRNNTPNSAYLLRPPMPILRLQRSGKGQYCDYDFNRSQYCRDGCCGDQHSSRNDVCCQGTISSASNDHGTLVGSLVGCGSVSLLLLVGYLIWKFRHSWIRKCDTRTPEQPENSLQATIEDDGLKTSLPHEKPPPYQL